MEHVFAMAIFDIFFLLFHNNGKEIIYKHGNFDKKSHGKFVYAFVMAILIIFVLFDWHGKT